MNRNIAQFLLSRNSILGVFFPINEKIRDQFTNGKKDQGRTEPRARLTRRMRNT